VLTDTPMAAARAATEPRINRTAHLPLKECLPSLLILRPERESSTT
jgi:hypothetical protein